MLVPRHQKWQHPVFGQVDSPLWLTTGYPAILLSFFARLAFGASGGSIARTKFQQQSSSHSHKQSFQRYRLILAWPFLIQFLVAAIIRTNIERLPSGITTATKGTCRNQESSASFVQRTVGKWPVSAVGVCRREFTTGPSSILRGTQLLYDKMQAAKTSETEDCPMYRLFGTNCLLD